MTWWLSPVAVIDDGPRLERAHGDWVWPQAQGRLGAALHQLGADGRYELLGLLNRGGQAYLWAARDHAADDVLVVVKTVNPRSGDPVDSARLIREARLLELLAGEPTVMSVRDWGPGRLRGTDHGEFETDRPWLVLPYRAHLSLDRALALSGGRLSIDAAWQIGLDLGTALQHLHRAQVVHRDLSLRNVLLTPTGCVLADLGMAWAASMVDQAVEQRFTTGITNQSRGVTWGWLAPEAARPPRDGGRPDRAPAADMFGWGMHVFCALTGRHPWAATGLQPNEDELYALYDQGAEPSLAGLDRAGLPRSLRQVVVAALSLEPGARPTAAEVLAELGPRPSSLAAAPALIPATAPGGTGTGAARDPATGRLASPNLDRPGRRTPLVAGLLALVTVLTLIGLSSYRASRQIEDAEQARAAAVAFPVAMRLQAALYAEATLPVSGAAASRARGRATTDRLAAELTADLKGLKVKTPASQPVVSIAHVLAPLPPMRRLVDTWVSKQVGSSPDEQWTTQNQVTAASATMVHDAQSLTAQIADAMDAQADDRAARDRVDVARAGADAMAANARLKTLGLSVINKQTTMNNDSFSTMTEELQTQRLQLSRAAEHADQVTGPKVLALANLDSNLQQWANALTEALNNDTVAVGDPAAFSRSMDARQQAGQVLVDTATRDYRSLVEQSLRSNRIRLWAELAAGVLLVLLAGLALGWRARRRPAGSSPSGGETAAIIDNPEPSPQRVPIGAGDV